MSKLNKAIEVVKAVGAENKEACLTKIMEACETYRSNATIYFNKAVERINGGAPTKAAKVATPKRPKSAKAIDVATINEAQPEVGKILDSMARASTKEFNALNSERKAEGLSEISRAQFDQNRARIEEFLAEVDAA